MPIKLHYIIMHFSHFDLCINTYVNFFTFDNDDRKSSKCHVTSLLLLIFLLKYISKSTTIRNIFLNQITCTVFSKFMESSSVTEAL